jgi:hypothetical protein
MLRCDTNSEFVHRSLLRRIIHRKYERSLGMSEMTKQRIPSARWLSLSRIREAAPPSALLDRKETTGSLSIEFCCCLQLKRNPGGHE